MLTRVPSRIQVRIIHPLSEEKAPYVRISEAGIENELPILKIIKKILNGSLISILLGLGIYYVLKLAGLDFGNYESTIVVFIPALLGFIASFILF